LKTRMLVRQSFRSLTVLSLLILAVTAGCVAAGHGAASAPVVANETVDKRLIGTWKPVSYTINGVKHDMRGLMIITPKYFMANTVFESSPGVWKGANANSGPYTLDGPNIVLIQWMQLHYRGEHVSDPKETFLTEGVVEKINYSFENGNLVFNFPSGNHYVSEPIRP
jgi:hypothetical protein